jgi:hypothetical protein
MTDWGRIAEDGTVFVRTADGERAVGSWQAGTAEEGLAFYTRRYDDLAAEVSVLEARVTSTSVDPKTVAATATKLKETLPTASVVGDLADLDARLDAVLGQVQQRRAAIADARAAAAAASADRKRGLVEEARRLSASTDWRATGDRYRAIVEEWKTIRGVDRKTDSELWEQLSAARREFDKHRRSHFADLDKQRSKSAEQKEQLATEAEKLADSDDWATTARRFRDLMSEWKSAGRAGREADDSLWARFKTAQDRFFTRRNEALSTRDEELSNNLAAKEALVSEAEGLDPNSDLEGARRRLRAIHDKWEKVGRVPRESVHALEQRLAAVETRVRDAGATARVVTVTESPLVIRLRESVTKLESRLARARASGDDALAAQTEESLTTQREWLAQAELSVADQ